MQGGVGDYTRELARGVAELDVEPHIITSAQAVQSPQPESPPPSVAVHPAVEAWGWRSYGTIDTLLDDVQPAIVHIQYQTAGYGMHPAINFLPLWLRWRRPDIHTIITYHDLRVPYLFPKAGPARWWVTVAPTCWTDAVIVTNAEDWQKLAGEKEKKEKREIGIRFPFSLLSFSPFRISLIPIGSNIHPDPPANFDSKAWRARIGIGRDETMLVYFGFLNASKGGETLIRGLGRLIRRGYQCRLVMLGGQVSASDPTDRAYLKHVEAMIDHLGLDDRVTWTGFVPEEEVSAYLLAADMAVLPYRDGASYRRGSLMAALAHGVPIVTTHPQTTQMVSGLPRLEDGLNVRLVPPDDPDALARAVGRLADDAALRRQLGASARQLSKAFTWGKIADRHREIYDQVVATETSRGD